MFAERNIQVLHTADLRTLVAIYRDIREAEDHGFRTCLDRDRYVRLVYATGAFHYGERFIKAVGPEPESPDVMMAEGRYPYQQRY